MIELPFYYGREKFMDYIISVFLGYGLGCLNPAWFISRAKHIDIRKRGTGNPGTTNAFINLGKGWGLIVLVCDLCKVYAAVKVCQRLFPESALVGVVAGCAAVMGHIFPFYLKFHGGKGVASFGGYILALDWKLFILLLAIGCVLALVINYGCSISFSAAVLFPVLYAGKQHSAVVFLLTALCSGVIIYRHMDNIRKIKNRTELPVRTFLYQYILKRRQSNGGV